MFKITLTSEKQFPAVNGLSILESAAQYGIVLPYSCKIGRCSSCKVKVIQGTTKLAKPDNVLSKEDRSDGWILSCIHEAASNLVLEATEILTDFPKPKITPCKIDHLDQVTGDVIRVIVRFPSNVQFRFIPGQYVNVVGRNGMRRSYSIASHSRSTGTIELHIKAVEKGEMSRYWFTEAKIGDVLRIDGPHGTFILRECKEKNVYFLATGTGIAPVLAMLDEVNGLPHQKQPKSVTVIWGLRHKSDAYIDLRQKVAGTNIEIFQTYSREEENLRSRTNYVQDVLNALNPDWATSIIYACGSPQMILQTRQLAQKVGLKDNQFISDAFVPSAPT